MIVIPRNNIKISVDDQHDTDLIHDIFDCREYGILEISPNDIVLDIGAHKGIFALWAGSKTQYVYCYEPVEENYNALIRNINDNNMHEFRAENKAVVGMDKRFLIRGDKSVGHRLTANKGEQVLQVKLQQLIDTYSPTVVKIDVEGLELEILDSVDDFKTVNQIIFEFHGKYNHSQHLLGTIARLSRNFMSIKQIKSLSKVENNTLVYCCGRR